MSNKENKTTETAEDKEFRDKAVEAGFNEVNTKEEIKKIKIRLDRLDRGGVERFKGERESLVERLKKYGVEYVSKKAKDSVEKIDKLAEGPEEKKIAEEGKEKIEEVKENLENDLEVSSAIESISFDDFKNNLGSSTAHSFKDLDSSYFLGGKTTDGKNDIYYVVYTENGKKQARKLIKNNDKIISEEADPSIFEKKAEVDVKANSKDLKEENISQKEEINNKEAQGDKEEIEISKMLKKELESLGINDEKLKGEAYKKFNELSSGSKLLVLKNLKGVILEEFTEESRFEANSSVGEVKGLFSKIRKSFKENRLANKSREEKLKELNKKGINENHEGKLNSLSEIISTLEIDVSEKDGKTEVSLLKTKEGMNEDQKKAIDELNLAANEFLSIPKEMAYESASKTDQK
ncbi:MAG: hypothetical protein WC164_04130, partial [Patescibacteria group bacterium]